MKNILREDKKAKTKAYFFKRSDTVFDKKLLNFLENHYKKTKKDIRVCLHKDPSDKHHDMVLLQKKKDFFKPWIENRRMGTFPHKHLKKGETYHLIKGKMVCVIFSNSGKIKDAKLILPNSIFRTPINTYHTQIPLSNYVIYHEGALGPFKKGNSVFPRWADKFKNNPEAISKFYKEVKKKIKQN
jgi:cupin fold WbuC family metalloprotein|tara:strand:- start:456 stop:1010 length:555 start_codon:yes stop_codon:yes gene_type:complete